LHNFIYTGKWRPRDSASLKMALYMENRIEVTIAKEERDRSAHGLRIQMVHRELLQIKQNVTHADEIL